MKRILIATSADWRDLHAEDRALVAELRRRGADVEVIVWNEPRRYDGAREMVVMRSVWDYQDRLPQFLAWLAELELSGVATWNPVPVLRWNSDKGYLRALARRGVELPRTEWIELADAGNLRWALDRFGGECVLKPTVSASGKNTFLVRDATKLAQSTAALTGRAVIAQEYLPAVREEGEWSLVFLNGEFSHAFRKRATGAEFRVQEEHGGINTPDAPPAAALATARQILGHAPAPDLLYARVDGVMRDGRFVLMELELLEPRLYPEMGEGVTERLAAAIIQRATR